MPGGLGGIDMDVEAEVMRYLPRKKRDNELRSRLKVDGWGKLLGRILTARDDLEAELGRYFVLSNPTPGTGLSTIAALTGFTDPPFRRSQMLRMSSCVSGSKKSRSLVS
jgi:hypothetical protein